MGANRVRRIPADERVEGPPTPGMIREQAVDSERMWAGVLRTEPGAVSGWHHHADYESSIYVLSGVVRMEFGPGGAETFDALPGDFVFVPPSAIHRESNPTGEPADAVVVRSGSGESIVNVEGPGAEDVSG